MGIKVVIEFQAKPGQRAKLKSSLEEISAKNRPTAPGFLGSTVYETLDSPDGLIEIADWESAQRQASAVEQAMTAGIYAAVFDLLAAPFKATRIG